jgi:transcriptional regulator with XRE-family HTH domain
MVRQLLPARSVAKPGAALKALRRKQGWTLVEVSRRTGLPTSTLSKIENDKMSLTFDKLSRIGAGLRIDIAALFSGDSGAGRQVSATGRRSIARAGEGKAIETRNYSHLYPAWELLNKRPVRLNAGDSIYFDSGMRHAYIAVSDGRCRVLSLCTAPAASLIVASTERRRDAPACT